MVIHHAAVAVMPDVAQLHRLVAPDGALVFRGQGRAGGQVAVDSRGGQEGRPLLLVEGFVGGEEGLLGVEYVMYAGIVAGVQAALEDGLHDLQRLGFVRRQPLPAQQVQLRQHLSVCVGEERLRLDQPVQAADGGLRVHRCAPAAQVRGSEVRAGFGVARLRRLGEPREGRCVVLWRAEAAGMVAAQADHGLCVAQFGKVQVQRIGGLEIAVKVAAEDVQLRKGIAVQSLVQRVLQRQAVGGGKGHVLRQRRQGQQAQRQ